MDWGSAAQWASVTILAIVQAVAITKGVIGRGNTLHKVRDDVASIKSAIEDKEDGLPGIRKRLEKQEKFCIETTTRQNQQINSLEGGMAALEMDNLRRLKGQRGS